MKRTRGVGGAQDDFVDPDELFSDDDQSNDEPSSKRGKGTRSRASAAVSTGAGSAGGLPKPVPRSEQAPGRTRPTNNQLL